MRRGRFPGKRHFVLAAALGAGVAVLPAVASSVESTPTIEAVNVPASTYSEEKHYWQPSQRTVIAGGAVTFRNPYVGFPYHGLKFTGGPATPSCTGIPAAASEPTGAPNWQGECTFSTPGTYTFICTVHPVEMKGTITVNANGTTTTTTTTTPTTTPTTTTTTTPTTPEGPPGSPFASRPALSSSQRGGIVKGSLDISKAGAGDRLEIDVLAKSASLAKARHVRVGRLVRGSVSAGKMSFVVKLNARARRALKRHHRLALTVKIMLTPPGGEPVSVTRSVIEHA